MPGVRTEALSQTGNRRVAFAPALADSP
jgi:hypothetical protein